MSVNNKVGVVSLIVISLADKSPEPVISTAEKFPVAAMSPVTSIPPLASKLPAISTVPFEAKVILFAPLVVSLTTKFPPLAESLKSELWSESTMSM